MPIGGDNQAKRCFTASGPRVAVNLAGAVASPTTQARASVLSATGSTGPNGLIIDRESLLVPSLDQDFDIDRVASAQGRQEFGIQRHQRDAVDMLVIENSE